MFYNYCLFTYQNPYKHSFDSIEYNQEVKDTYKKYGIIGLSKLCDQKLNIYIDSLSCEQEKCAACHKKEHLQTCSKCKKAKFCNRECQRKVFKFHNFDCKKL